MRFLAIVKYSRRLDNRYMQIIKLCCILLMWPILANAVPPSQPPFALPHKSDLDRIRSAIIYTDRGELHLELFPEDAPWHVANFKYLADKGYYKKNRITVFEPGLLIQSGDPSGTGFGGPKYSLPPEFNPHRHTLGTLGMARARNDENPERRSHASQFYITLGESDHITKKLDGSYTIFGQVLEGLDVLKDLRKGDYIRDIKVFVKPKSQL